MLFINKLKKIDVLLCILLSTLAFCGFIMLYSVAGGSFNPWALNQIIRFVIGFFIMITIAIIDIRIWYKLTWVIFIGSIVLLIMTYFFGEVSMGAKRWINLGVFRLQPAEIAKIATILALSRLYSNMSLSTVSSLTSTSIMLLITLVPAILIYKQPDLGTAILLIVGGFSIAFFAGLSWKFFVFMTTMVAVSGQLIWSFLLKPYQQLRISTFLNPDKDPLGAGYHIIQSEIALGSGGIFGRGYMNGTQSSLGFLPEKQTDFIFTVIGEEFGFVGALFVFIIVLLILYRIMHMSFGINNKFASLLTVGIGTTFFLYILINTGMIMGLFPVVGVPFPLISYGGTVMLTIMTAFGFVQSAWVHRHIENPSVSIEN